MILIGPPSTGSFVATVNNDGDARGRGAVHVRDGVSHTILIANGSAQAICSDTNGDGTAGLSWMSFELRDVRTGAKVAAEVSPVAGDIDKRGRVKVTFTGLPRGAGDLTVDALFAVVPSLTGVGSRQLVQATTNFATSQ